MIIDLTTLPATFQHYVQTYPHIELQLIQGQLIATPKERPFNFDMDKMDKAIHSGVVEVPKFATADELADWLGGAK